MSDKPKNKPRRWWPALRGALTLGLFAALVWLLISHAGSINWAEVLTSLRSLPASALLMAAIATVLSYGFFASYESLSVRLSGLALPIARVARIAFVSYAFNLNFGAWVGGVGLRYRLYSRYGLKPAQITRILGISLVTNWVGYLAVGGAVFTLGVIELPPGWKLGNEALRLIGVLMLMGLAAYLSMTAFARRRSWTVRGYRIELPSLRAALLQLVLASTNWLTIAFVVYSMMQGQIAYPTVLAVFLLGSIAGVVAHVPAGLGVLEAVYLTLLGHLLPAGDLIAALLAYRAVYYLSPLILASLVYVGLEAGARRRTLAAE